MKNHNLKIIVSITACLVFFLFFSSETGMAKERIDGVISYDEVNIDLGIINCEQTDLDFYLDFSPEGWKDIKCNFWIRADQDIYELDDYPNIFKTIFDRIKMIGEYLSHDDLLAPLKPESEILLFVTTDAGVDYPAQFGVEQDFHNENLYEGIPIPVIGFNNYQPNYFYFAIPEAMNYQSLVFPGINLQIKISENMEPNIPEIKREILDDVTNSFTVDDYQIDLSNDFLVDSDQEEIQSVIKVKNLDKTKQRSFVFEDYFQLYDLKNNEEKDRIYWNEWIDLSLAPLQEIEKEIKFVYAEIDESLPEELYLIPKFDSNVLYKIHTTEVVE
ncbi:hypothetical protein [Flexilinea flocculi]|uniref:Uncharacterized protein n=1 Tax=Flexilinea flocculi TaxID=1678840 RepID=A0A0S7BQE4_9CHLR|nr:hypothetical protein [Flexilinea flocculi]GAP40471.1 hypothetical protein ATC1_13447 [Flexilinea flocculi]